MFARRALPILVPVLFVAGLFLVVGCAKRPALTQVSAPAPTGVATSPPASAPAAAAPAAPAPAPTPPPALSATAAVPATPPPPKEFADVAWLRDIHFDFDRSNIRPDAAQTLTPTPNGSARTGI